MIKLDEPIMSVDIDGKELLRAIDIKQVSTAHRITAEFEAKVAHYLDIAPSRVVATNSGTAALHLALKDLGVTCPDNEVILPATSFIATANVITYTGATPVFVDIDPDTWVLSQEEAQKACSGRTRAVIGVDLYGNPFPCGLEEIDAPLIIDAAQSFGSSYAGKKVGGNQGPQYTCFSFNGNKTITTGGGGALIHNGPAPAESVYNTWALSTQARGFNGTHWGIGFNYRMPALNAALGISQLSQIDGIITRKNYIHARYKEYLSQEIAEGRVTFQKQTPGSNPVWWRTVILLPKGTNVIKLQRRLLSKGVQTGRAFRPITHSTPYSGHRGKTPNAERLWGRGLWLPSHANLSTHDLQKVCVALKEEINR